MKFVNTDKLAPFRDGKYICLETFKKNGTGVKTPLWYVLHDGKFYMYSEADSWKVKRIRNHPRVRIAPCDMRGNVKGEWIDTHAQIISGDEEKMADKLLDQKYFLKKIFNMMTKLNRHKRAMIRVEPE
jgi:PPOX class probable F420-dependent enzyme